MSPIREAWNVPFRRNQFFTGREEILKQLHDVLGKDKVVVLTQPQTVGARFIAPLGGVGKTQTAVEYAYRYREDYDYIFWVRADTPEEFVADMLTVAQLLNLPEKDAQDQSRIVSAVGRWLGVNTGWLLILDNADNPALVQEFVSMKGKSHILLTTHAQGMGKLSQRVEIAGMEAEEGALLLLRRARLIAADATLEQAEESDQAVAKEISQAVAGLPLALDQAGAYIEETQYGLMGYMMVYRVREAELMQQRGGRASDYTASVAASWSLCLQKLQRVSPAAIELLHLCAFLAPDAIPEEVITGAGGELGATLQPVAEDAVQLNATIGELLNYSLVWRNTETHTLTIHRLLQAALRDELSEETRRQWAERAVRAVNSAFPDVELATWLECQRCLPHALVCAGLIEQWEMVFPEAGRLLNQAGHYLYERAQLMEAEPLLQQALVMREQALGSEHAEVAQTLNKLGGLYYVQGRFAQAESLYRRALAIDRKVYGTNHPEVATDLNNLAGLYHVQGQHAQAEPLYRRALAMREQALGLDHPDTATSLNNLAVLYQAQGEYAQAEPLYQKSLAVRERVLGPEHPETAQSLNNLAGLYYSQGEYAQAEPLLQRALAVCEHMLGSEHPETANSLNNLALLYADQGKYAEAEPPLQRALAIYEQVLGPHHAVVAMVLETYADLLRRMKRHGEAKGLEIRAKSIRAGADI